MIPQNIEFKRGRNPIETMNIGIAQVLFNKKAKLIKEEGVGGVSDGFSTLNNTPGMGSAVPAGVNKVGSGDKWSNIIGKKPYTQSANSKKKKKKKKLEEDNINPRDPLGTAMAKKMKIKVPFKKKKDPKNQNSMTMKAEGFKIMPFEEFKKIYESKNNSKI